MADVLERLVVSLALDGSDYNENLKSAQGSLDGFASSAKSIGGGLSLAVTAPLTAIGLASIAAASDVNESMSKVEVVFGENAAQIESWSTTAAESLGQSQQGALEAAGTFGNLFSAMGLGQQQTLDMSKGVVQLASDLASFNNISPEVALEKLRAGLVGEAEPLRTLGVNLTAAAVASEAVRMGLAEQGDELTTAQKAQASYSLILAQTTAAQGDFTRTSDGLANSQRIMQAELSDTTAELGKELLPIALEVAHGLSALLGWFRDLSPETKHWVVVVAGIAAAAGPVLVVLGTMASGISAIIGVATAAAPVIAGLGAALTLLTGPIGLIVLAIAGLAVAWSTDFLGIRSKTEEFWGWLTGAWPGWMGNLQSGWQGFSDWWQSDTDSKIASAQAGWQGFMGWLDQNTGGSLTTIGGYWQSFSDSATQIQDTFWQNVGQLTATGIEAAQGAIQGGTQIMQGDWSGGLETLRSTAEGFWGNIYSQFQTQIDTVTGLFSGVDWGGVGTAIVQGVADGITNGISWIEDAAKAAAQAALDAAKWILGINSPSKAAADQIGEPLTEGVGVGAVRAVPRAAATIQDALNGLLGDLAPPTLGAKGGGGGNTINITIHAGDRDTANQARLGIIDGLRQAGLA